MQVEPGDLSEAVCDGPGEMETGRGALQARCEYIEQLYTAANGSI